MDVPCWCCSMFLMSFDFDMSDLERKIVKALSVGSVRAVDLEIILESDFWCDFVTPQRRAGVVPSMCRFR